MSSQDARETHSTLIAFRRAGLILAGAVALLGVLVMGGWALSLPTLKSVLPGLPNMVFNTALGLAAAGMALCLSGRQRPGAPPVVRSLSQVLALIPLCLGVATLVEYGFTIDLPIDHWAFVDPAGLPDAGRPSPVAALCLALCGWGILRFPRNGWLDQASALLVLLLAMACACGHLLGVPELVGRQGYMPIAVHTAIGFAMLASSLLALNSGSGLMQLIASDGAAGLLVRRCLLAPPVLLLLGWAALEGMRWQGYGSPFAVLLMVLLGTVFTLCAAGLVCRVLQHSETVRQQLMQELQARLRDTSLAANMLAQAQEAVVCVSLEGEIISANPAAGKLFAFDGQELIGQRIERLIPVDQMAEHALLMNKLRNGVPISQFETVRVRKDGGRVELSMSLSPIVDQSGQITAICINARDIRIAKVLRDNALAAAVIEQSDDAIIATTPDGLILSWNRGAQKLYGFSPAEMIGRPISSIYPADRLHEEEQIASRLRAGERIPQLESQRVRSDGTLIDVAVTVSAVYDNDGQISLVSRIVRDISERVRLQASLNTATADLQQILEHSPAKVALWNPDRTCRYANKAYASAFGLTPDQILGKHAADVLGAELYERMKPQVDAATSGHPQSFERVTAGADGTVRYETVDYRPDYRSGTEVPGIFVYIRDITPLRNAERSAADSADRLARSNMLMDRAGRLAQVGGWALDVPTQRLFWSDEVCRLHGVPPGHEPSLEEAITHYPGEARHVIEKAVLSCIETGRSYDLELPFVTRGGEGRWIRAVGEPAVTNGQVTSIFGAIQDITARRQAQDQIASQNALMRVTLDSIGDAVMTTDRDGHLEWLNPVACKLTGWPLTEARGRPLEEVFNLVWEDTRRAPPPRGAHGPDERDFDPHRLMVLISRDGTERGVQESAAPIRDENGQVLGMVIVFHDVSEQRRLAREITHRASHDALTGLANRSEFELQLKRLFNSASRSTVSHALLYIDLDQFKVVNDACGHAAGDDLLREVARIFRGSIRSSDLLARLGGDEFGVLLENCQLDHARQVAQQLCARMDEYRFIHSEQRFRIGASIGMVPVDARWPSDIEVLQAADRACYAAKEAGRNRVHEWLDSDTQVIRRHDEMQWVGQLESALDENRFRLFAQRINPCASATAGLHFEVLLRLVDRDGELISPGAFLPAAERFNLASRIDRWVLRETLDWISQRSTDDVEMVAINLSGQSLDDRTFHQFARELISNMRLEPRKLCLEITETAAIMQMANAIVFIKSMRELGVRIALDDFGAGISSFGYLKTLPVDLLKIDGQFVRNILDEKLDRAAVSCFREVASICGLQTIAECVETRDVLEQLRAIGIDYAQGYLMHKPEPLDSFWAASSTEQQRAYG